jgi:GR25 family glycosyltransferase involved in LPS biosynthesis
MCVCVRSCCIVREAVAQMAYVRVSGGAIAGVVCGLSPIVRKDGIPLQPDRRTDKERGRVRKRPSRSDARPSANYRTIRPTCAPELDTLMASHKRAGCAGDKDASGNQVIRPSCYSDCLDQSTHKRDVVNISDDQHASEDDMPLSHLAKHNSDDEPLIPDQHLVQAAPASSNPAYARRRRKASLNRLAPTQSNPVPSANPHDVISTSDIARLRTPCADAPPRHAQAGNASDVERARLRRMRMTACTLENDGQRGDGPYRRFPSEDGALPELGSVNAFVVNMPFDKELRQKCSRIIMTLGLGCLFIPAGIVGKELVEKAEKCTTVPMACKLTLRPKYQQELGIECAIMRTKQPDRAIGAFGCSMSHCQIWFKVHSMPQERGHPFALIVEDDIQLQFSNRDTTRMLTMIAEVLHRLVDTNAAVPDVVYLFALPSSIRDVSGAEYEYHKETWPESLQPVIATKRARSRASGHRASGPKGHTQADRVESMRMVSLDDGGYGTVAYFVRRTVADRLVQYTRPDMPMHGPVWTSDGAIRKAASDKRLTRAHFVATMASKPTEEAPCDIYIANAHIMGMRGRGNLGIEVIWECGVAWDTWGRGNLGNAG